MIFSIQQLEKVKEERFYSGIGINLKDYIISKQELSLYSAASNIEKNRWVHLIPGMVNYYNMFYVIKDPSNTNRKLLYFCANRQVENEIQLGFRSSSIKIKTNFWDKNRYFCEVGECYDSQGKRVCPQDVWNYWFKPIGINCTGNPDDVVKLQADTIYVAENFDDGIQNWKNVKPILRPTWNFGDGESMSVCGYTTIATTIVNGKTKYFLYYPAAEFWYDSNNPRDVSTLNPNHYTQLFLATSEDGINFIRQGKVNFNPDITINGTFLMG